MILIDAVNRQQMLYKFDICFLAFYQDENLNLSFSIEFTAHIELSQIMPLAQFPGRGIRKRGESVFREDEVAVGAHDPVRQQICIMRSDDDLRICHLLQYHDDTLGKLIMIEDVKLVNEYERGVLSSFVPIIKSIQRLHATGSYAEKGKRLLSIEVQSAFAVGIFLDGQVVLDAGSVQKALKLFEGVRLKDKVIIIVTLGLITNVPVLIQAAEPNHFCHESHHLP